MRTGGGDLELTAHDLALHERAIARLRAQLFRRHVAADYGIVEGTEEVLPASAYLDVRPGPTPAPRALHLGGLRYYIRSGRPEYRYQVQIKHWRDDTFRLHWSCFQGNVHFTRFALDVRFSEVDECLLSCVQAVQREDQPIPALTKTGE